jgi:hypothetical protein
MWAKTGVETNAFARLSADWLSQWAMKYSPKLVESYLARAESLEKQGRPGEAREIIAEGLKIHTNDTELVKARERLVTLENKLQ